MKFISSRDNPQYKELKQLASSSRARRLAGRTLLDGIHLCEAYLQHVGMPVLCIVNESFQSHFEVAAILARCGQGKVQCVVLPESLYNVLSQVEHGVGLLFAIATPASPVLTPLRQSAVLLDNLQDPGNLGSILRSAAAAGIRQVYCSSGTVFSWSPKVLRAGMGAHFLLEVFENVDLAALIKDAQVDVLATSSHAEKSIYEIDLSRPVAWLFGHEGQGVDENLLALASHQASIPHLGAMESLNVAASAAVCFFEQARQTALSVSRNA
ncbi:RNA methyltransferase [soil metagenome]